MGQRRHILLIAVNDPGFFLSHRLPIAEAAAAAGYDVHVATPRGPKADLIESHGFTFHPVPLRRHSLNVWREPRAILAFYRLFRSLAPDVVHLVTVKPILYGGLAARLARVPAVVSAITGLGSAFIGRGPKAFLIRHIVAAGYRIALRHPNIRVIFQNPDDLATFGRYRLAPPEAGVVIKGSGVDAERYKPSPEPAGIPVVMLPARMLRHKGIFEFVAAALLLRARGVSARFVLVGDSDPGNPASVSREQLERWRADQVVEWWGFREDMPLVLGAAHVVCLPSHGGEGVPKVLLEAAGCGRPIVASDVPGCREIVRQFENGLLVPVGDAAALATAINRLISDPELRQRMRQEARRIVESEFTIEQVIRQTLAVYESLLPGRVPRHTI